MKLTAYILKTLWGHRARTMLTIQATVPVLATALR